MQDKEGGLTCSTTDIPDLRLRLMGEVGSREEEKKGCWVGGTRFDDNAT